MANANIVSYTDQPGLGSGTPITFDTATQLNGINFDSFGSPTTVHIVTSGIYNIEFIASCRNNTGSTFVHRVGLYVNGINVLSSNYGNESNSGGEIRLVPGSTQRGLNSGDVLTLVLESGGDLAVVGGFAPPDVVASLKITQIS
ncbi:hypothetical protein IC620_05680 [Hazenella sp. IB182357]|uniref:Uncharacterized protein n=1 Tax=Polycladospora coralii TaxID=2771432 RepID=A0A926RTL4_9BACL|nr:hypothetical protein [Polycladospora coralii]MBD1371848.1 hypothetical protein [Polycladospora coralii]MBS7529309.1 hypothetical protein [Polycladospora coralii]